MRFFRSSNILFFPNQYSARRLSTHHFNPKKDLFDILESKGSKHYLEGIIANIKTDRDVMNFAHRYSVFNGNFAGGVSALAGAFHIRQDLFKKKGDVYQGCDDVSADIASYIYFAAEDEYANRDNHTRVTHRGLGQFFLEQTLKYFLVPTREFNKKFALNQTTLEVLEKVNFGYKVDRKNEEIDLYHGLGFHLGSEILADQEFNIIDAFFREHYPDLVSFLEKQVNSTGQSAYDWIRYHTFVEVEHFDNALRAVHLVLESYAGQYPLKEVYDNILKGFLGFAQMQQTFFSNILADNVPNMVKESGFDEYYTSMKR